MDFIVCGYFLSLDIEELWVVTVNIIIGKGNAITSCKPRVGATVIHPFQWIDVVMGSGRLYWGEGSIVS